MPQDFDTAYRVACLGVTEAEGRPLMNLYSLDGSRGDVG